MPRLVPVACIPVGVKEWPEPQGITDPDFPGLIEWVAPEVAKVGRELIVAGIRVKVVKVLE